MDLRGMGQSTLPDGWKRQITMLELATDVFDVVQAVGWKNFYLLGHGIGGMIALVSAPFLTLWHPPCHV